MAGLQTRKEAAGVPTGTLFSLNPRIGASAEPVPRPILSVNSYGLFRKNRVAVSFFPGDHEWPLSRVGRSVFHGQQAGNRGPSHDPCSSHFARGQVRRATNE
jgi:hypothetical protein